MFYSSAPSCRKRILNRLPVGGRHREIPYKGTEWSAWSTHPDSRTVQPSQYTWSEGHPIGYKAARDLRLLDYGGPFLTGKVEIKNPARLVRKYSIAGSDPAGSREYEGTLNGHLGNLEYYQQALPTNKSWESFRTLRVFEDLSSRTSLEASGSTAISRCSPTQQHASLFVTLKELYTEGLPKLPGVSQQRMRNTLNEFHRKKKLGLIKGTAEEYLNVVFGWSPLLADVGKIYKAIRDFEKNRLQLQRDSGRVVRRSYRFPSSVQRTVITDVARSSQGFPWNVMTDSRLMTGVTSIPFFHVKRVERDQWFSGAFTYYLHEGDASIDRMVKLSQEADHLFGLSPTIETLWDATPWTWFVDWFVNAGDVLDNFSDMLTYGLVMHYGYMMEHTVAIHREDQSPVKIKQGSKPVIRDIDFNIEAKQRIRATPFGFGLTDASLSAKQKLILAALAITRV